MNTSRHYFLPDRSGSGGDGGFHRSGAVTQLNRMPHGYYLHVRVIKGIDLLNRDASFFSSGNYSDPYVQLSIGDPDDKELVVEGETVVIDDNLNPEWNETLKVFITDDAYADQQCVLRIWDKDPVGKNAMGQVSIKLKDIPLAGEGLAPRF